MPSDDKDLLNPDTGFSRVNPVVDIPAMEREVLRLWRDTNAFAESIRRRPADNEYVFYDGPPFPTGSPHYGNLLAGVIKDMVPRYWTMRGYRVERRFGWDTHGLPIEMEVEKRLGISGPDEIAAYGIDRFNQAARSVVQANTENWEVLTERIGRWVDFENDYKTMDPEFMESVWWVFKQLWDKGLVYKDFKVLPYSWGAATPLSNFEANKDYRDVEDPSITVRLVVLDGVGPVQTGDYLLIWTTTPWTLPGNLAIAVGEDNEYVRVKDNGDHYWIARERASTVFGEDHVVVEKARGSELLGVSYQPPFDYFAGERERGAFVTIASSEVTVSEGTGLVHMAPAYGEADFYALKHAGLDTLVDPVNAGGNFTEAVPEVAGLNVKEADAVLIELLKASGNLVHSSRIVHSYPFCERTGTPLIYKAIPTWFVAVERFRERMVELNETIHWVPDYVGTRRFGNWLVNARDWAISRNRYWGSCIPVWECDRCDEQVAIGSLDELEALSGQRPDDLHKHVVDEIGWACPSCAGAMIRVPEVLDGWFESGSMPYGMHHYPFENAERFEAAFPAKFIAEGLDQTRGWFYTLIVLSTALFDKPAFENCVVNGLILAEDGRKMSKSLKNYPDPSEIFDVMGADALRAFLINSPVLRAEPLRFTSDGVADVVRTVLLPMWNTYSFFTTYAQADGITIADLRSAPSPADRPEMDRWILSVLQSLVSEVNEQMEGYYLYNVVPPTLGFIDHLTNWYVRRSRRRFWRTRGESGEGDADKLAAFATLYEVLTTFIEVLAPVLPFITEHLYQDLVARHYPDSVSSVHHRDFPDADSSLIDTGLEEAMAVVREVVHLGRTLRKKEGHRVRQPLGRLTVLTRDPRLAGSIETHTDVIAEELNVKEVVTSSDEGELVVLSAKANFRKLGPLLGADMNQVAAAIAELDHAQLESVLGGGTVTAAGRELGGDDLLIERTAREGTIVETGNHVAVALDTRISDELLHEGVARELISRLQRMRREADLDVTDRIAVSWSSEDPTIRAAISAHRELLASEVLAALVEEADQLDEQFEIDDRPVALRISRV
ncbi:MAG TPA: isoleucine--tRNA ligase [Acidimicrobiia bacterium]|nr:isoleucine--tRNA ligase [Acidimicrobiia bacterium]